MIVITGASRGIGKYLFEQYRQSEEVCGTFLNTTVPASEEPGSAEPARLFRVDVSNYDAVHAFVASIEERLEAITLINCAGVSYNAFLHKSDPEAWKHVIDVNLTGTYNLIRALLPFMREQQFGRIINFSSVVAQKPTLGVSAYAASKAALWGLTRAVAVENGSKGITCNAINLGYANIGMGVEQVPSAMQEQLKAQIPSGSFCAPSDILRTVEYIRQTAYLNGTSIDLTGGLV